MKVLWIDDDSPSSPRRIDNAEVVPVQSCGQSEKLIESGQFRPDWILVDLIVPQQGWGRHFKKVPGIDYIAYLSKKYGKRFRLAAYSVALTDERRRDVEDAGAEAAFDKTQSSFKDVLSYLEEQLRNEDSAFQRAELESEE